MARLRSARHWPVRLRAWLGFRGHIGDYRVLDEWALKATRKSDTVFIFGSGYSLNGLTAGEWSAIGAHDTIGFNWFVHEPFVRCDYHLVREICPNDLDESVWWPKIQEYFHLARTNPHYAGTIFLVQTGFRATNGNRAIGFNLVPTRNPVFLWRTIVGRDAPSLSFADGLSHATGTLSECINFAFLLGWTTIVLVGVDLYDRRYFWLGHEQSRSETSDVDREHRTVNGGIVDGLARWRRDLEARGVRLFTYNPKSLLAGPLPVWPAHQQPPVPDTAGVRRG